MTKNYKLLLSNLRGAEIFLREAMVLAGTMEARDGIDAMKNMTDNIAESMWFLNCAIVRIKTTAKKKLKKNLTTPRLP